MSKSVSESEEVDLAERRARFSEAKRNLLARQLRRKADELGVVNRTIPRRPDPSSAPLSFSQQRLWFLDQLEAGSASYNCPTSVRLTGSLNRSALERSLSQIVRRHDSLRTTFVDVDGKPLQLISPPPLAFPLPVVDLTALAERREAEARRLTVEERLRPFELRRGPLLRATLLQLAAMDHVALLTMHHIVSDGWSMVILVRELGLLYTAATMGRPSPLPALPIQYGDFVSWQRNWLQGPVLEGKIDFWRRRLAGAPSVLDLPMLARPAGHVPLGRIEPLRVGERLSSAVRSLSQSAGATPFMVLLAVLDLLLSRYTGQLDIVVGSSIANRNLTEIRDLIGFFINILVLRSDLGGAPSFRTLLGRVRETALEAYSHEDLPFERLVEELRPERSLQRTPLFQVMFLFQNTPDLAIDLPGLSLSSFDVAGTTPKFELTIEVADTPEGFRGGIEYDANLFAGDTMARLASHFETLLESAIAEPDRAVADLAMLTGYEVRQLLAEWNDTRREHPGPANVSQLFSAQVERTPDAVALSAEEGALSYRDLDRRAGRLTRRLVDTGMGTDGVVALLAERGLDFLTAVLGIWKTGGAYLPLDTLHPPRRIQQVLERSRVRSVLVAPSYRTLLAQALAGIPDAERPEILLMASPALPAIEAAEEDVPLPTAFAEESLAYVIYTSGSTGLPKGAMVDQRGMLNHLWAKVDALGLRSGDTVAQTASQCFDISVWQFLAALLVGGRVHVFKDETTHDPVRLLAAIAAQGISILETVPSLLAVLLTEARRDDRLRAGLAALRWLIPTGEALPPELCRRWLTEFPAVPLMNAYGPTECSDDVTHWAVLAAPASGVAAVPIGRPVDNLRLHLLDRDLGLVPSAVLGELYVGGVGLGRGYINDPARTAEVFLPNPFGDGPGGRLYRTGDLARWLADGTIEFLGRVDQQVKVRGFRIELGEIEAVLGEHPDVREAVVLAQGEGELRRLLAYLVPREGLEADTRALRGWLGERLPDYMVPVAFVVLAGLPLTPNAKVDRRALAAMEVAQTEVEPGRITAPRTPAEGVLAGIWSEVLGRDPIGVETNFFDLGGHSLLATQVIARVRQSFGVELPLRKLFEAPTVSGLALELEAALRVGQGLEAPPLVRADRDGVLPLSFAQQRLWFLDQLVPESPAYNIHLAVLLEGALDRPALAASLREVVRRHESLRTSFVMAEGKVVQRIGTVETGWSGLHGIDLAGLAPAVRPGEMRRLASAEANRPFHLGGEPLLRTLLLRLEETVHAVVTTVHHIVSDGWSMELFVQEVSILYAAFAAWRPSPLPELAIQYADFSLWQRRWLQGEILERHLGYWRQRLAGAPAVLDLPTDRPRPAVQSLLGASRPVRLDALVVPLRELGRREGMTLFITLLTGFQALLSRYASQEDLSVGSPLAGRTHVELENLIGFFVSTLVLRTRLGSDEAFRTHLARLRETALEAHLHQDLPFEKLVEELAPERSLSYAPLFQVMFALQNVPRRDLSVSGLRMSPYEVEGASAKFDLTLILTEAQEGLSGVLEYDRALFDGTTVDRLLEHLQILLAGAASDPARRTMDLPLLSLPERQALLEWNGSAAEYPADGCLHELFAAQAERTPEAVALVFEGEVLSYGELNARANRLAHRLLREGVRPESLVGVCLERSLELVPTLLGILKAGGAYVPLDPASPRERLALMLEDAFGASPAPVVLTQQKLKGALPESRARVLCLDLPGVGPWPASNPEGSVGPDSLAYVIFTSGSTGRPKGVMNSHRGIVNRLLWMQETDGLRAGDRVLQKTPLTFDVSVWELFWPLLAGVPLVLARPGGHQDPAYLVRTLVRSEITTLHFVPAMLQVFLEEPGVERCISVRRVIASGEALSSALQRKFFARFGAIGADLYNLYGPTEAAVEVTFWRCQSADSRASVPIGRPVANSQIHLLDRELWAVPVGIPGELYIAGIPPARGYVGRPELTAERFLPDPFGLAGSRMYRTGDLARHLAEGEIEYLGRTDHQVKVRGVRIEMGEIETVLARQPGVQEAVVLTVPGSSGEPGDQRLVACVVPFPGLLVEEQPDWTAGLRQALKRSLPEHMLPASFLMLEALPLSASGKVDRRALSGLSQVRQESRPKVGYVAPRGPMEEMVAAVWSEVLVLPRVSVEDNFFDLGGHSLLAMRLASQVGEALGIELPLRTLFEAPTVARLAVEIEGLLSRGLGIELPPIRRAPRTEAPPLSFAQERLWFLDRLRPGSSTYNLPAAVWMAGRLDLSALAASFAEVVRRHEILRTTFATVAGKAVQVIDPAPPFALSAVDLGGLPEAARERVARQLAMAEAGRPFDLARGPLVRAVLLRLTSERHLQLLTLHHVITDGWSMGILVRELVTLYAALSAGLPSPLAELPIQYADFAIWQRQTLAGEVLERQLAYWRERLEGAPEGIDLALDSPRPAVPLSRGARLVKRLPASLGAALAALSRRQGTTLFMTLLAAWYTLLLRETHQRDLSVGTPIANRTRAEIAGLIGFFVNTLVLRIELADDPGFEQLLSKVREVALGAYAHQDLPFQKLVEELRPEGGLQRSPLFHVMVVYEQETAEPPALLGLELRSLELEDRSARFDLTLVVRESLEGLITLLEYDVDLFRPDTVLRLLDHFAALVEGIAVAPGSALAELPILSAIERHQILLGWNDRTAEVPQVCLHELFERSRARHPDRTALLLGSASLSYAELDRRAELLAFRLATLGVGPEVRVGLAIERSFELLVGILAVQKAGGAYIPLDPASPQERLGFLLADAKAKLLLTRRGLATALADLLTPVEGLRLLCLDEPDPEPQPSQPADGGRYRPRTGTAENLAYVIYTSGSTGTPNGVLVPHRGAVNLIRQTLELSPQGSRSRVLQLASIGFDASVLEIFLAFAAGGILCLISEEERKSPRRLSQQIANQEVTTLVITPSQLSVLLEPGLPSVTSIIAGGEALPGELVAIWAPGRRLLNCYGPTEASIFATLEAWQGHSGPLESMPSIGRSVPNVQAYVVDEGLRPVPIGTVGELVLGGVGLARGYLGRAEKTAEKFIPSPFAQEAGERLYRTGDFASLRVDGRIDFRGRRDDQVKVRGFRIELGEVEAALSRHPAVRAAVVLAPPTPAGGRRLVAYVVFAGTESGGQSSPPSTAELRGFVGELLPDYMVPSQVVTLAALPTTTGGKLDRRALPDPEALRSESGPQFVPPRTPIESLVAEAWVDVLKVDRVGVDDDFFELGGNSIQAAILMSVLEERVQETLPMAVLFAAPTVAGLAAHLEQTGAERRLSAPLSSGSPVASTSLVPLETSGTGPPLFLVHPVGGNVLCYAPLARRLGRDRPIFGMQSVGLVEATPHERIEEMAASYLERVFEVQPEGPYLLAGWSMGGIIAYEMAQQLWRAGAEVGLLGLLDCHVPPPVADGETPGPDDLTLLLDFVSDVGGLMGQHLEISAQQLAPLPPEERLEAVLRLAEAAGGLPAGFSRGQADRLWRVFRTNARAAHAYRPLSYPGRLALLLAGDGDAGWGGLAEGGLETYRFAGDHYTLLREPVVLSLARCLASLLTSPIDPVPVIFPEKDDAE